MPPQMTFLHDAPGRHICKKNLCTSILLSFCVFSKFHVYVLRVLQFIIIIIIIIITMLLFRISDAIPVNGCWTT